MFPRLDLGMAIGEMFSLGGERGRLASLGRYPVGLGMPFC